MALTTITLQGNDYRSFVSVADADTLLIPTEFATQWAALTVDAKATELIRSTRLIRSFDEFSSLTGDELNVGLACARLAIAPVEAERNISRVGAGSATLTFRPQTELDRLDRTAVRMLRTAVLSQTSDDSGTALPETPRSSFASYVGADDG